MSDVLTDWTKACDHARAIGRELDACPRWPLLPRARLFVAYVAATAAVHQARNAADREVKQVMMAEETRRAMRREP